MVPSSAPSFMTTIPRGAELIPRGAELGAIVYGAEVSACWKVTRHLQFGVRMAPVHACGVRRPLGLQGVGLPCLMDFLNEVHRFPCKTVWSCVQPLLRRCLRIFFLFLFKDREQYFN